GEYGDLLAGLDGGANHAEGGAITGGRERPRVAVRQHARAVGQHLRAMRPHCAATRDVLVVDLLRLAIETVRQLLSRLSCLRAFAEHALHAIDRPEQVDRCRPRRGHHVADLLELDGELTRALRGAAADAQRDAPRRRDTDRGGAPNHHRANGFRDLLRRAAAHVNFLTRQLALVHHHDDIFLAIYRREHVLL